MNYRIHVLGMYNDTDLYEIIKLLLLTLNQADYETSTFSDLPENPFAVIDFTITAKGSLKNEYKEIYIDMNNNILSKDDKLIISRSSCGFDSETSKQYYFGMLGLIFQMVEDLNTAFVTGYLLEQKRDKDLEFFRTSFRNSRF